MWPWILCLCLSLGLAIYSCVAPTADAAVVPIVTTKEASAAPQTRSRMRKPQSSYEVDDEASANTISSASSK